MGRPRKPVKPHEHVYFIEAEKLGLVKIGWAKNAEHRIRCFQTGSPDRLALRGVIYTDDGRALERHLHKHFAVERVHGEWFQISERIREYIEECLWSVKDGPRGMICMKPRPYVEPAFSMSMRPYEDIGFFVKRVVAEAAKHGIEIRP